MKRSKIFTAATLLVLAVSNLPFSWVEQPASAKILKTSTSINSSSRPSKRFRPLTRSATPGPPHVLPGSYYNLQDNLSTTLILNNKGPEPLDVQPTLFNLDGVRLDVPLVTVNGTSFRTIDLREWAAAGAGFDEGSLQLVHYGMDMQLGAQIKIVDQERSLIFDEQLMANMAMSSRLEGVWWLPSYECNIRLALSNTTNSSLTSTVLINGVPSVQDSPLTIELAPHQTRIINSETFRERAKGIWRKTGGISISHDGAPGALLARGFIDQPSSGFSSLIEFSDPAMAHSSKLNGGGLRLTAEHQKLTPVVVARNLGTTDSDVSGAMPYTASDGCTAIMPLPLIRLAPGEIESIDVERALRSRQINIEQVKSAGLEFTYSSEPGSVFIAAQSVSSDGNQVFRLPMVDAAAQPSSTGGYPWSINGSSSTFVYITNATDSPQQYVLQLNFEGGGVFAPGLKSVEPQQTDVIDVRSLRDEQVKDEHNQTIPMAATRGQVQWSIEGPENLMLIGRAEQADLVKGMSSSYACVNCCPASCAATWLDPGSVTGGIGDTTQFGAMQQNEDCFGNLMTPFSVGSPSWSSTNSSVASVSGGLATALSLGSTYIGATWTAFFWDLNPNNTCTKTTFHPVPTALCDVLAPTLSGPSEVTRGGSATFTIANAGNGQISGWQFTDGTNTVTRATGSGSSTWSGIMVKSGTVSVTVTQGGNTFPLSKSITVNARSGFAFSAVSTTKVANGSSNGDGGTISVPNPPGPSQETGRFYLRQGLNYQTASIADGGPNHDFKYVTSVSPTTSGGVTTAYLYVIAPDLENTSSTFYLKQCGNYNAQTNPNGFISGANLLAGTVRHESGATNSHYQNYVVAQNSAANNVGVVGETQTGSPSESISAFDTRVGNTLSAKISAIIQAAQVEPCAVNYSATCVLQGYVNYSPYQSCP